MKAVTGTRWMRMQKTCYLRRVSVLRVRSIRHLLSDAKADVSLPERTGLIQRQRKRAHAFLQQEDPANPGSSFFETYLTKRTQYDERKEIRASKMDEARVRFANDGVRQSYLLHSSSL